jgi:hypothetical protein
MVRLPRQWLPAARKKTDATAVGLASLSSYHAAAPIADTTYPPSHQRKSPPASTRALFCITAVRSDAFSGLTGNGPDGGECDHRVTIASRLTDPPRMTAQKGPRTHARKTEGDFQSDGVAQSRRAQPSFNAIVTISGGFDGDPNERFNGTGAWRYGSASIRVRERSHDGRGERRLGSRFRQAVEQLLR